MKRLPTVQDCGGCGVCCLHMGYPPYMGMNEHETPEVYWLRMPEPLKANLLEYVAGYSSPPAGELAGPCIWLDQSSKLCMHHEFRPRVCRDFRVASKGCLEWRRAYKIDAE